MRPFFYSVLELTIVSGAVVVEHLRQPLKRHLMAFVFSVFRFAPSLSQRGLSSTLDDSEKAKRKETQCRETSWSLPPSRRLR